MTQHLTYSHHSLAPYFQQSGDTGWKALNKTSLAMAQRMGMFQPYRSCSWWSHKLQLLIASGISHLYLEREAARHVNTWNHSEQKSWAVTKGPFTSGCLHRSILMGGCWFCHTSGGCWTSAEQPQKPPLQWGDLATSYSCWSFALHPMVGMRERDAKKFSQAAWEPRSLPVFSFHAFPEGTSLP